MRYILFLNLLLKSNLSLVIGVLSAVSLVDAQEDFTAETASAVPAYSTLSEEQALLMLLYEAGYIDRKTMTGEWRSGPLR